MNKSIIVYGPPGCGKTRWADRIAKHFGLGEIVDDWGGIFGLGWDVNTLYLTEHQALADFTYGITVASFAEVAQQINDAIPLTDWFSIDNNGQPSRPGWYEVRYIWHDADRRSSDRNYFDGSKWRWGPGSGELAFGNWVTTGEYWRGLSEEPIIVLGA